MRKRSEILGAALLGTGCDEAIHCILDVDVRQGALYGDSTRHAYSPNRLRARFQPCLENSSPFPLEQEAFVLAASEDVEVRRTLFGRVAEARRLTDRLFDLVRADSLYERPIPERHRIIFYLGHLEAFDWNLLHPRLPNAKAFDPEFDRLFAFGIDPVDGGLPSDHPSDWPARAQIERYRNRVRTTLDAALADHRFCDWSGEVSPQVLLNVAIEHRLMHAETLAYMLHQLPFEQKRSEPRVPVPQSGPVRAAMVEIPAGRATLGMPRDDPASFGWDNEFEATARGCARLRDRPL